MQIKSFFYAFLTQFSLTQIFFVVVGFTMIKESIMRSSSDLSIFIVDTFLFSLIMLSFLSFFLVGGEFVTACTRTSENDPDNC